MKTTKETITATGVLYPLFESSEGAVTGVMLSANDENEYVIIGDRFINELINLCQEEVHIHGSRSLKDGRWQLEPHSYEVALHDGYDFYNTDEADGDLEDQYF